MKTLLAKYGSALLLYAVIIIGVIGLNARLKYVNEQNKEGENSNIVAMGEYYE